jgi:hypothetical protein
VESATWEDFYVVKKHFLESVARGQATPEGGEVSRMTQKAGTEKSAIGVYPCCIKCMVREA